jgi:hypothetical protein
LPGISLTIRGYVVLIMLGRTGASLSAVSGITQGPRPGQSNWGGFWLAGGAEVSLWGWSAQWLSLASFGGLALETALIEWGTGTWPVSDTPWISLVSLFLALAVMVVDVVAVGLLNWLVRRSLPRVDAAGLAALVPEYLALRPDIGWRMSDVAGGCFEVRLWPVADPSRAATLHVAGDHPTDFRLSFGGHESIVRGVERGERVEVLFQQLGALVSGVRGPSAVLIDYGGDRIVRTELVFRAPDETDVAPRHTLRALWSRVRGRSLRREIRSYPPLAATTIRAN